MMPRFPLLPALFLFPLAALATIRVSPERELTPRVMDLPAFDQRNPHIATDGDSFVALWEDDGHLTAMRLGGTPFGFGTGTLPDLAWGTDRYLAIWLTHESEVRGRFIERDGTLGEPFHIGAAQVPRGTVLAFNGSVFLVLWRNIVGWSGAVVDPSGHVAAGAPMIAEDAGPAQPDLVAFGETFYFAYALTHPAGDIAYALPVDASGQPGARIQLAPAMQAITSIHAAVRPGKDVLVAWSTPLMMHDVRIIRGEAGSLESVSIEGMVLENVVVDGFDYLLVHGNRIHKRARRPNIASFSGFEVAAPPDSVMADAAAGSTSVMAILLRNNPIDFMGGDLHTYDFNANAYAPLVTEPRQQEFPAVALNAHGASLVAWGEHKTGDRKLAVMAARNGAPPIEIGTSLFRPVPAIASNGKGWLVVWLSYTQVLAVRIAEDGTPLDTTPLTLSYQATGGIGVAWDGTSYVVAFALGLRTTTTLAVVRVPSAGEPSPIMGLQTAPPSRDPVVAAGPNGTLILWNYSNELRGVLLSRTDAITPLALPGIGYVWSVASNGDAFLAAAVRNGTLRWMCLDASGNATPSTQSIAVNGSAPTRVSAFGDAFLILWPDWQLHAAIVDRDGELRNAPEIIGSSTASFAAAGDQLVISREGRVYVQTIAAERAPRRRAVR